MLATAQIINKSFMRTFSVRIESLQTGSTDRQSLPKLETNDSKVTKSQMTKLLALLEQNLNYWNRQI